MLSIFLSYSRDTDKERAKVVRTKLEALGITVFQDIDMLATSDSSAVLDAQIGDAAGVFVLWTASSIKSKWVIAEAQKGLDRDVLVTAVFDNISPRNLRLPFNGLTTPNISDWIESGAKAAHPGWRSILGAIGSLVARPLIDLALTIEAGTPAAKLDFVKKYPDDLFSKTFAAEFKSAKKQEFSQRAIETKQKLEDRLEQAGQKLDALQIEFENKLDSAIKTGNFSSLDPRMIIDNTLAELSQNTEIGKGVLEIRLRETVKGLADANSRLEASKVEFEKLKAEKNAVETELSDKVAQNSRLTNDLSLGRIRNLANYVLLLIAILVSASFAIYYLRYTKSQDQITALTGKFNDAQKALGESQTQLNQATDRAGQTGQTLARLNDLQAKLTSANDNVASLTRQRQDLSTQLSDAQSKLSDAQSKLKIAGDNGASLAQQKNEFSSQIGQAQTNLKAAGEAVTSLTAQKNELSKQLDDARAKLSAFDTQKSSLTSQLNDVLATLKEDERRLKTQADQETSRRAAEESCNNLAANQWDSDLPRGTTWPPRTKLESKTIIDSCLSALSSLPKETLRRLLVQLSRGFTVRGNGLRLTDPDAATRAYGVATSLTELASDYGSAQAANIAGWIYGGGVNNLKNYSLQGTPKYDVSWGYYEKAAKGKNPWGLVMAASYLIWPDCTNSSVVIDPDRGFEYLKAAKDMKFAQAFYVEGYFRYFGAPPGVKREQTKGLDLIKQAKDLGYPDADTFLATPPTRPPSGCPARY